MNMFWIVTMPIATVVVVAVVLLAGTLRRQRRRISGLEGQIEHLASSLNAICASAVCVDRRVVQLERIGREMRHRQENIETHQPGDRPYGEAIQMVHQGAAKSRLVDELGLSKSEAELLVTLHGGAKLGNQDTHSRARFS
jgi:hypothetical protein